MRNIEVEQEVAVSKDQSKVRVGDSSFVAIWTSAVDPCHFCELRDSGHCTDIPCCHEERADKSDVYFRRAKI